MISKSYTGSYPISAPAKNICPELDQVSPREVRYGASSCMCLLSTGNVAGPVSVKHTLDFENFIEKRKVKYLINTF